MKDAIQAYIDAYNVKDIPAMLDLLDDQIIFENVSNTAGVTKTTSRDEFQQLAFQSAAYFSERRQLIRFLVLGLDSAAVEIDYQATLAQDFPNGLKAGQSIHLRGVSIFEQKDGKFTRISDYS
ncbi:nuclear transport factor 2 family protein [Spirosoma lituiforme]|jgi:hypothetical protein